MRSNGAYQMLDEIAGDVIPNNVDLTQEIRLKFRKKKAAEHSAVRYFQAAAIAAAALLIALLFVPGAATAMQRALAYIPGLGMVEPGQSLRILSTPVSVEREGITVTVEDGATDLEHTLLLVSINGMQPGGEFYQCSRVGQHRLRLEDGALLDQNHQAASDLNVTPTGYRQWMEFPALPQDVTDATLEIPCLLQTISGRYPEHWEIPLHFEPASESTFIPVIEPTRPEATVTSQSPAEDSAPTPSPYGISTQLESIVPLENGYIFNGNLQWNDASLSMNAHVERIEDAGGQIVPFEERPVEQNLEDSLKTQWSCRVDTLQMEFPLHIIIVPSASAEVDAQFTFDPGNVPFDGQHWELDEDVSIGEQKLHISNVRFQSGTDGPDTFIFGIQSDTINMLQMESLNGVFGGGGGGGGAPTSNEPSVTDQTISSSPHAFSSAFSYNPQNYHGPIEMRIVRIGFSVPGFWQVSWQP